MPPWCNWNCLRRGWLVAVCDKPAPIDNLCWGTSHLKGKPPKKSSSCLLPRFCVGTTDPDISKKQLWWWKIFSASALLCVCRLPTILMEFYTQTAFDLQQRCIEKHFDMSKCEGYCEVEITWKQFCTVMELRSRAGVEENFVKKCDTDTRNSAVYSF